jgi:hypothetical protein
MEFIMAAQRWRGNRGGAVASGFRAGLAPALARKSADGKAITGDAIFSSGPEGEQFACRLAAFH